MPDKIGIVTTPKASCRDVLIKPAWDLDLLVSTSTNKKIEAGWAQFEAGCQVFLAEVKAATGNGNDPLPEPPHRETRGRVCFLSKLQLQELEHLYHHTTPHDHNLDAPNERGVRPHAWTDRLLGELIYQKYGIRYSRYSITSLRRKFFRDPHVPR